MTEPTAAGLPGDVPDDGAGPGPPLLSLLLKHQSWAWRRGERPAVEDYLAQ